MNVAYTIVANAIHAESTLFGSPLCIVYNNIRINTGLDSLSIVNAFNSGIFDLNDMRNILYIYISVTNSATNKVVKATEYIKMQFGQESYNKLQKKYIALQKANVKLQMQNENLIQTCNSVCKLVNNTNILAETKILTDILKADLVEI